MLVRVQGVALCSLGLLAGLLSARPAAASELVDVLPLTDRILMLHFDDGYVVHHTVGHPRSDEKVVADALDVKQASVPATYKITSPDDPAYSAATSPVSIGRKSKGTDFAWFADKWVNGTAVNERPDHASEHWVYLTLPSPMQKGKSYTIQTGDLATNGGEWNLTFDETKLRSEAVHVNLIGYVPDAPEKFAYVYHWMGDKGSLDLKDYAGKRFDVINVATGESALSGSLKFRAPADRQETFHKTDSPPHGSFLKAEVYEADLSALKTPGEYVVAVEGIGRSFPFKVDADVYRPVFYDVARGLYHNRSGIALEEPYTTFTRPAPGNPNITPGFKDKLIYTRQRFTEWGSEGGDAKKLLAESPGTLMDSWGWYQDAGDWDGYYSHLRVAQELMMAYELAPANFADGELNIPEGKNGIPDILDEATWLPRFYFRQRHELMDKGWGTGGVGSRVAGDGFGSDEGTNPDGSKFGRGSWQDTDRFYAVSGEDPWSTLRYAGAAAQLAYNLDRTGAKDPDGVDWAKEAAESYDWAQKNFRPGDDQKSGMTRDARTYAAAALFRLTGDKKYEQQFIEDSRDINANSQVWDDSRFGPAIYALGGGKMKQDPATLQRVRGGLLHTADSVAIDAAGKRALRWGGNWSMPMLVGQQTTPWMLEAAVGYALAKDSDPAKAAKYRAAMYTTADYFMGTNPMNMTFITGVGPRHPNHPFHMDAWYNGKDTVHPGIIPYGQWRKEKDVGQGPWDQAWGHKTLYPGIDEWPGNERFFDNRCSPMGSEFTVHQNSGPAAAFYGMLCAPGIEEPNAKK